MSTFAELLDSLTDHGEGRSTVTITDDWLQGRTAYGGLTAALCFEATRSIVDDLPVRAAQISFIGPVSAGVSLTATLLRRGRTAAFVGVDATVDGDLAARGVFTFGVTRDSALNFAALPMPEVGMPEDHERRVHAEIDGDGSGAPTFVNNFEFRPTLVDNSVDGGAESGVWLRLRDDDAPASAASLLALADGPPPAALGLLGERVPLSSMTWMAEFLTDGIDDGSAWYFTRAIAESARSGYSSQEMTLWDAAGAPIMIGRQTIAIFG
ncbi:MAG: thioesterase family protein [Acidobacteria bacterium]|nr:thioesterase family protein [Acidobacteriota bacterium]